MADGSKTGPRVKVVGVCASGKSTLVQGLRAHGYVATECRQEHSYVPDMWRRLHPPDVLIYLDAPLDVIRKRRPQGIDLNERWLAAERKRLRHAREHCDLYFLTSTMTADEVLARTLRFLRRFPTRPDISPAHPAR